MQDYRVVQGYTEPDGKFIGVPGEMTGKVLY